MGRMGPPLRPAQHIVVRAGACGGLPHGEARCGLSQEKPGLDDRNRVNRIQGQRNKQQQPSEQQAVLGPVSPSLLTLTRWL